jgi:D-sedoheptulose 7-phosphate isomerase
MDGETGGKLQRGAATGVSTFEARASRMRAQAEAAGRIAAAVGEKAALLAEVAALLTQALDSGAQVFFFGNGGSAADAEHWAAELSGRFYLERAPLPALALTANSAQLTAVSNDYGYGEAFARPLRGLARPGDVAVGLSTSGESENVLRALDVAREQNLATVGLTGRGGGDMAGRCDHLIRIPSDDTARIQEGHQLCAHLICEAVENALFG